MKIRSIFFVILALGGLWFASAEAAPPAPAKTARDVLLERDALLQSTVKDFYAWYLTSSEWPLDSDGRIYEFVTQGTVQRILDLYAGCNDGPYGEDYFTKSQDWDEKDWLKSMTVSAPLYSSEDTAIVAVRMGTYDEMKNHLFVVLKSGTDIDVDKDGNNSGWKITDVAHAENYLEPSEKAKPAAAVKLTRKSMPEERMTNDFYTWYLPYSPVPPASPERTVKDFYTWYFTYPNPGQAMNDAGAHEFLTQGAIYTALNPDDPGCDAEPYREDFFTKMQDWGIEDAELWLHNLSISTPLYFNDNAVVAVKMEAGVMMRLNLFVILAKADTGWKIANVVNSYERQEFSGSLYFFSKVWTVEMKDERRAIWRASRSGNLFARYFADMDLQVETEDQMREIRRALNDALTLPLDEFRAQRYANYRMEPNSWTFGELLQAYFAGVPLSSVDVESDAFYEDTKKPAAIPVLKHLLNRIDWSLREEEEWNLSQDSADQ